MLNYELIGDNDYIFDPIGTIFANRGIDDSEVFSNLDKSVAHHHSKLKNMNLAVECLSDHLKNKSKMLIVVDPDVDGFSSSAILFQYLSLLDEKVNLEWIVRDDKSHGLDKLTIPDDVDLLLVPDSGSSDFVRHKELKDKGIDIIVLDHHEVEKESENAIIVNNQLGNYPNKNFSGAGVVIKFCEALDEKLKVRYSDSFYDLVALGNIADSMLMTELETRYYVQEGLKDVQNNFFNALLAKQEFSTKGKINITTISFYIAPLINSVIRVGSIEDKIDMFKSFIGVKDLVKYKPRGGDETLVSLVDDMARRCANTRAKQNRVRDKLVDEIEKLIKDNKLNKNKVIFIDSVKIDDENLTGLVANVIASRYKRPSIVLSRIDKKGFGSGSARGYDKGGISEFKETVVATKLFEYASGHQGAFGVKIHQKNFNQVNDKLNEALKDYDIADRFIVDFKIKANGLNSSLVEEIGRLEDLWGRGFEEPYIFVYDIPILESYIKLIGKKENTLSIEYKSIKFMLFKTSNEVYKELANSKYLSLVGKAKLNTYNDITTPQIFIEAFETHS